MMCADHPPSRRWSFIPTPDPLQCGLDFGDLLQKERMKEKGGSPRVSRAVGTHPDSYHCPRDQGVRDQPHSLALGRQQHGEGTVSPLAPGTWGVNDRMSARSQLSRILG